MKARHRHAAAGLLLVLIARSGAFAEAAQEAGVTDPSPSRSASPGPTSSGPRVRITTGSDVELSGIVDFQGGTPATKGALIESDADTVRIRVAGQPDVTVLRPRRSMVGVITQSDAARLIVAPEGGSVVTIPRDGVARYEISRGRVSRGRNVLIGLLVGGVAGAAIGFAHGHRCQPRSNVEIWHCWMEPEASTLFGLMVGAGGGAAVGAFIPRHERWTMRPLIELPNLTR